MAFKNTNLSLLAYNTGYILRRNAFISRLLSQSSGERFTPGNGYTYEIFTQDGQFTVSASGNMDVLLVGGGGGGGTGAPGGDFGGGGGAGGMLHEYNYFFPEGVYEVTIGGGGRAGSYVVPTSSYINRGDPGTPSIIKRVVPGIQITATGGGGGGSGMPANPPGQSGQPGGSGGGAGSDGGVSYFGNGTTGQGNPGGTGSGSSYGGGGGGAGATGGSGPGTNFGGNGLAAFSGDTGIPNAFGTPGPTPGRFFAGGGWGGGATNTTPVPAERPVGGGGANANNPGNQSGLINTGGGGSGNNSPNGQTAFVGGSGIIILRYVTSL